MILLIVTYVLHAVKREPKGFEDVHENISAKVSFQDVKLLYPVFLLVTTRFLCRP
jgi:hypothetical protein